jgi:hypothetical protein
MWDKVLVFFPSLFSWKTGNLRFAEYSSFDGLRRHWHSFHTSCCDGRGSVLHGAPGVCCNSVPFPVWLSIVFSFLPS